VTTRPWLWPALRLAFGLLGLVAVGTQLTIQVGRGYSVVNFFSYFTNLSNLFAAVVLILGAARPVSPSPAWQPGDALRCLSAVNMIVVGVVYALLLRHADLGSLRAWINTVLHEVMPVAVALDWLIQPPRRQLGAGFLLLCLAFPLVYLAYILLRGAVVEWYPYPFLDPDRIGGYAVVALYVVGIGVTFLLVAWLLRALGNRRAGAVATEGN
jgi:hypothetical protein